MAQAFLRLPEVMRRVGLSRSSIYLAQSKNEFPHSVQIGVRSVAWPESEIERWIASKLQQGRREL